MEANLEESKNAIVRLLELIDYANQMQEQERKIHPPESVLVKQYDRLRNDYLQQLAELLKVFKVKIEIPTDKAA
jgi:hypothetical protein